MLKYFRDRKSIGWLVGAFLLVLVIFAFVAFYVPDFMTDSVGGATGNVAWVEGTPIASAEFLRTYRAQENQYRAQLGAQFSPDLMRQLGFDNLVVQELIRNKMLSIEAERQGLAATDEEVSEVIMTHPSFSNERSVHGPASLSQPAVLERNDSRDIRSAAQAGYLAPEAPKPS